MQSFYADRFKKRKKTVKESVYFSIFGILVRKSSSQYVDEIDSWSAKKQSKALN